MFAWIGAREILYASPRPECVTRTDWAGPRPLDSTVCLPLALNGWDQVGSGVATSSPPWVVWPMLPIEERRPTSCLTLAPHRVKLLGRLVQPACDPWLRANPVIAGRFSHEPQEGASGFDSGAAFVNMRIEAPPCGGYYLRIRYDNETRMRTPSFSLSAAGRQRFVRIGVKR